MSLAALKHVSVVRLYRNSPRATVSSSSFIKQECVVAQHTRKCSVTLRELKEADVIWENRAVGKTSASRKQARAGHWERSDTCVLQWTKQRWNLERFQQRLNTGKMCSGVCNFPPPLKEQPLQHLCQSHAGLAWFEGTFDAFKLDHDEERPTKPNAVPIKHVKHLEVKRRTNANISKYMIWSLFVLGGLSYYALTSLNKYNVLILFILNCKTLLLLLRWDKG